MLNTIINLVIIGFGLNYYFKYQNLKKEIEYDKEYWENEEDE